MKKPVFRGTCTALITPFSQHGINFDTLRRLLERQTAAGVEAVVLCGTTGEAATMTESEQLDVIRFGAELLRGRMTVIAGTGSNCTAEAVRKSRLAQQAGAEAVLVVTPYYNEGTEQGLIEHYLAVADAVSVPVIAYNVPSRTGVSLPLRVCEALSRHENINGIKEASGDIARVARLIGAFGGDFFVYSGNDDQNVPILSLGGQGVISVLANVAPRGTKQMVDACLRGDCQTAAKMQCGFLPLIDALFSEVNPVPVKAAMNLLGFDAGVPRLPLTEMKNAEQLTPLLRAQGL